MRDRFTRQAQIGDVFHVAEGPTQHFEEEIEDLDLLEDEEEFEGSESEISDNPEDNDSSTSDDDFNDLIKNVLLSKLGFSKITFFE